MHMEVGMTDDFRDDPRTRNPGLHDPTQPLPVGRPQLAGAPSTMWAWIGGAIVLAILVVLIFGSAGDGDRTAGTGTTPPAATTQMPGSGERTTTGQGATITPAPSTAPAAPRPGNVQ
jgi:hypothetical protein